MKLNFECSNLNQQHIIQLNLQPLIIKKNLNKENPPELNEKFLIRLFIASTFEPSFFALSLNEFLSMGIAESLMQCQEDIFQFFHIHIPF